MTIQNNSPSRTDGYSLFNAMDGSLPGIDARAFDRSLVLNILFQEKLLVYDGTFFTCENLLAHLAARPGFNSLFEVACQQGLVIPAFREGFEGLRVSAETLRARSPGYELPAAQGYRDRIINAVDAGIGAGTARPIYLPPGARALGEGYEATVRALLCQDDPPAYVNDAVERSSHFSRVWERTKRWRYDVVEQAARLTKKNDGLGLRRQVLFNIMGDLFGIGSGTDVTHPQLIAACNDLEDQLALEAYMRWLAQCHFVNQARAYDVSINFPVYHHDQDFILDSILRSPLDGPPEAGEGFRCEVELPPLDRLAHAQPHDLVAIRRELGGAYLAALRRWQAAPDDARRLAVQDALVFYCQQICARHDAAPIKIRATWSTGRAQGFGSVASTALGMMGLPLISNAYRLGTTFIGLAQEDADRVLRASRAEKLEITLPILA